MPRLVCDGHELEVGSDQTVLDALLAAGLQVASSCRAGACQSCLVQATEGPPPAAAQAGLKPALRQQGFFLACQARLEGDLRISLEGAAALRVGARVAEVSRLAADVLRVLLEPGEPFPYRAGQFLTLMRADGLARAYSLASLPAANDPTLELHVRVLPGGVMSNWLASDLAPGSRVQLRGPSGDCFYTGDKPEQPLVLAGTGTGLAPLWGILRDALSAQHAGPIQLWHGARTVDGLYLREELKQLTQSHPSFTYNACVLEGEGQADVLRGRLDDLVLQAIPSFKGRRVYLCGDPELVQRLKRRAFLAGANLPDISADPFLGQAPPG